MKDKTFEIIERIIAWGYKSTGRIDPTPFDKFVNHTEILVQNGQYIMTPEGVLTYFKVTSEGVDVVRRSHGNYNLPDNFTKGDIIYVETLAIDPAARGNGVFKGMIRKLLDKEPGIKVGFWCNSKGRWQTMSKRRFEQ